MRIGTDLEHEPTTGGNTLMEVDAKISTGIDRNENNPKQKEKKEKKTRLWTIPPAPLPPPGLPSGRTFPPPPGAWDPPPPLPFPPFPGSARDWPPLDWVEANVEVPEEFPVRPPKSVFPSSPALLLLDARGRTTCVIRGDTWRGRGPGREGPGGGGRGVGALEGHVTIIRGPGQGGNGGRERGWRV